MPPPPVTMTNGIAVGGQESRLIRKAAEPTRVLFLVQEVVGFAEDVGGGEAVFLEEGFRGTGFGKGVAEADEAHGDGMLAGDGHGNDAAQAAMQKMFLG